MNEHYMSCTMVGHDGVTPINSALGPKAVTNTRNNARIPNIPNIPNVARIEKNDIWRGDFIDYKSHFVGEGIVRAALVFDMREPDEVSATVYCVRKDCDDHEHRKTKTCRSAVVESNQIISAWRMQIAAADE